MKGSSYPDVPKNTGGLIRLQRKLKEEEIRLLRPDHHTPETQYTEGKNKIFVDVALLMRKLARLSETNYTR